LKYLLDTHAAVWLLEGNRKLGARARAALEAETKESIALSGISLLEIALLEKSGVLALKPDAASGLRAFAENLTVLPITASIAADAVAVGLPHRDPFDRVITATARVHGLALITKDRTITRARVVTTLW
jgi:PIN domain nuclease of toxin-antitoxin system